MTRFDARLTKEQKELFEYASSLGGYKSLSEFVIQSVQEKAKKIVEEHQAILRSKADQELFFDALLNPPLPNPALKNAFQEYQKGLPDDAT